MNTVIYYPRIFPSPDWLKLAALCWDQVYRLVPSDWSYNPRIDDPQEVNELDRKLGGILRPFDTNLVVSPELDRRFIKWFKIYRANIEYEKQYRLYEREVPFYLRKVSERVQALLKDEGYRTEDGLIYPPAYIAQYYLSLCASYAVQRLRCDAVTNEQKFTDIIFDSSPFYQQVATAVLQAYLPENLVTLRPERIRELRESKGKEMLKYQAAIQSLVDEYGKVASVGEYETVKRRIIAIATDEVEKIKQNFQHSNQRLVLKSFSVSLTPPALAASIASLLHIGIIAPVGIAAALSVFAVSILIDWNEAKSAKSDSPWSYVLNVAQM